MSDQWLTSEQATRRLGVRPQTLYAYVSRGLIRSERLPGSRRSRFRRDDVERHAARVRTGGRAGALEVIVETQLTSLDPDGHLAYRGWDVADAVATSTFEAVAHWLWLGEADPVPFAVDEATLALAERISGALGPACPIVDRWRSILAPLRGLDPLRTDRRPAAVAATGRTMIATLVASSPVLGRDVPADASVAARLWPRLTRAAPSGARIRALDGVLILLADHELATSTLAARIAASTRADPYLVVQAGLATLGGSLHGGSADLARRLLVDAAAFGAGEALGSRLDAGTSLPGFGHSVYRTVDPRTAVILDLLEAARCHVPAADEVLALVADRDLSFPNADFALAVLAEACEFEAGALEAVFALARIVGWLAHAIEEYPHALRFRTRAAYTGPRPSSRPGPTAEQQAQR